MIRREDTATTLTSFFLFSAFLLPTSSWFRGITHCETKFMMFPSTSDTTFSQTGFLTNTERWRMASWQQLLKLKPQQMSDWGQDLSELPRKRNCTYKGRACVLQRCVCSLCACGRACSIVPFMRIVLPSQIVHCTTGPSSHNTFGTSVLMPKVRE